MRAGVIVDLTKPLRGRMPPDHICKVYYDITNVSHITQIYTYLPLHLSDLCAKMVSSPTIRNQHEKPSSPNPNHF